VRVVCLKEKENRELKTKHKMTTEEAKKAKSYIDKNYSVNKEELKTELQNYLDTNNARNANKMTFASLSNELRKTIAVIKGNSKGKLYK
jgi:hypothetical protein